MPADKEQFGVTMEEELAKWKTRISESEAEAKKKGPDYFERYMGDLQKMLDKYETAKYKLTLFRKGSGGALHDLKEGVEKAFSELKTAVGKAKTKF